MAIVIPWIFFSLLWLAFVGRSGLRQGFVYAAIVYTCCLVFAIETLSKWSSLQLETLGGFWIGLTVLSGFYLRRRRKDAVRALHNAWARFQGSRFEISAVVLILASVLLIAVVAPPNNWESMDYRMARIAMWIQQGSIDHYPAHYLPQLYHPPLGEWNILLFQILSGGDRFANTVEWSALAGCGVVASLIARELKKSFPVQVLAAVIAVTLPMGLMQSTSTQNALLVSFWSLAFAMFAIQYVNGPSARRLICCGFTLGFALLSKATAYAIVPGVAAALFLYGLVRAEGFRSRVKLAGAAALIVAMAMALNIGHYTRNWDLFEHPISPPEITYKHTNHQINVSVVMANLVRNSALHWGVPGKAVNDMTLNAVRRVFGDTVDKVPGTTRGKSFFRTGVRSGINEYIASNFLHFWLLTASIFGILLFRRRFQFDALTGFYALAVILGAFFFCALLQWEQWNQRYHTSIFMIGAPIAAVFLASLIPAGIRSGTPAEPRMDARQSESRRTRIVAGVFLALSIPWIIFNESRPVVSHYTNGHRESIFSADRMKMYFAAQPDIFRSYVDSVRFIAAYNPRQIGILPAIAAHDYTIWVLFRENLKTNFQLKYLGVENVSKDLREGEFAPPFIFSNRQKLPFQVIVEEDAYFTVRKSLTRSWQPERTVLARREVADEIFQELEKRIGAESKYLTRFDDTEVYHDRNQKILFYVKDKCLPMAKPDKSRRIFLHVTPADADDLPDYRKQYGFDALDFSFIDFNLPIEFFRDGRCVSVRKLPDYGIVSIRTGESGFEHIEGSDHDDTLAGNVGGNVLRGLHGADTLRGGEGSDTVLYWGSKAGVTVTLADDGTGAASGGDAAGDTLRGVEHVEGSGHADVLTGNSGNNVLFGHDGADTLRGRGGDDRLRGGGGRDRLIGGAGADDLDGGEGEDTVSYRGSGAGVTVALADDGTGAASGGDAAGDTLRGVEHIEGSEHADVLTGNAGRNVLFGHDGADTLRGRGGDDWLIGGAGADDLDGGEGSDRVAYWSSKAGVTVTLADDGTGTGSGGDAAGDTLRGFEHIEGSEHGDVLTGNAGNNVLRSLHGADTLRGGRGDDILRSGPGDDTLEGGAGADLLRGNSGADDLDGGEGEDTVSYQFSRAGVTVTLADDGTGAASGGHAEGDTLRGFERIEGSDHADVLTGNAKNNVLYGHDGADTLRGGGGGDVLTGGADDDLFRFDSGDGADTITDFTDGEDRIDLRGHTGVTSFGDLTITQPSGDAVIDLGGGDHITLTGVRAGVLDGSDFLF